MLPESARICLPYSISNSVQCSCFVQLIHKVPITLRHDFRYLQPSGQHADAYTFDSQSHKSSSPKPQLPYGGSRPHQIHQFWLTPLTIPNGSSIASHGFTELCHKFSIHYNGSPIMHLQNCPFHGGIRAPI